MKRCHRSSHQRTRKCKLLDDVKEDCVEVFWFRVMCLTDNQILHEKFMIYIDQKAYIATVDHFLERIGRRNTPYP